MFVLSEAAIIKVSQALQGEAKQAVQTQEKPFHEKQVFASHVLNMEK